MIVTTLALMVLASVPARPQSAAGQLPDLATAEAARTYIRTLKAQIDGAEGSMAATRDALARNDHTVSRARQETDYSLADSKSAIANLARRLGQTNAVDVCARLADLNQQAASHRSALAGVQARLAASVGSAGALANSCATLDDATRLRASYTAIKADRGQAARALAATDDIASQRKSALEAVEQAEEAPAMVADAIKASQAMTKAASDLKALRTTYEGLRSAVDAGLSHVRPYAARFNLEGVMSGVSAAFNEEVGARGRMRLSNASDAALADLDALAADVLSVDAQAVQLSNRAKTMLPCGRTIQGLTDLQREATAALAVVGANVVESFGTAADQCETRAKAAGGDDILNNTGVKVSPPPSSPPPAPPSAPPPATPPPATTTPPAASPPPATTPPAASGAIPKGRWDGQWNLRSRQPVAALIGTIEEALATVWVTRTDTATFETLRGLMPAGSCQNASEYYVGEVNWDEASGLRREGGSRLVGCSSQNGQSLTLAFYAKQGYVYQIRNGVLSLVDRGRNTVTGTFSPSGLATREWHGSRR